MTAAEGASLGITKALSPVTVSENGEITYTFVISNYGNAAVTSADNAAVLDTFDPRLENITVTYNGTAWTAGTEYTYDEASGVFTTAAGQITLPAATYTQDPVTGAWSITPAEVTLTVTGTV